MALVAACSAAAAADAAATAITFQVADPLYEPLLSRQPFGLGREGAIYWAYGRDRTEMRLFALQYGERWTLDDFLALAQRHKLRMIDSSVGFADPEVGMAQVHRRHGTRGVVYPAISGTLADPENIEQYLAEARAVLAGSSDAVWALFAGDESQGIERERIAKRWLDSAGRDPVLQAVDREVRECHGFGRYGLPQPGPDEPLQWIAFSRWLNDRMLSIGLQLRAIRDELAPDVRLISWDSMAIIQGLDYGRWGQAFDIVTHQTYPQFDPNRCEIGFLVKVLVDLTSVEGGRTLGPEVWPCVHVEHYPGVIPPEDVREYMSQALRNGALGLHFYPADCIGIAAGKGSTWLDLYGAPARWNAVMETIDRVRNERRLQMPHFPRAAILLSTDTINSTPESVRPYEAEALYAFLGPRARRWFVFLDDNQVERGERALSDFDTVFVPRMTYARREVVRKLRAFVRAGGRLVIFDPQALTRFTDGGSGVHTLEALTGVHLGATTAPKQLAYAGTVAPVLGPAVQLAAAAGAPLAWFEDGSAAIVSRPLGRGNLELWAHNPLSHAALANPAWQQLFCALADRWGLQHTDVWRYKLKPYATTTVTPPPGVCLTNNALFWENNAPRSVSNLDTGGSYSYSLAPDMPPDNGTGDLPFSKGNLTDRPQAPTAGDCFSRLEKARLAAPPIESWVAGWGQTDAFTVTFDLREERALDRVRLLYSGHLPAVTVSGSVDGATWEALASASPPATEDVLDCIVGGLKGSYRYVRLEVSAREPDEVLTLAEVEIWGP
jgi:hypothetical protein